MKNEHKQRLDIFSSYLKKENIDLAMITYPPNIFYYTGFNTEPHERFLALVIDTRSNETFFFVPELDVEVAKEASIIEQIIPIADTDNPFEIVNETINPKTNNFGIEKKVMTVFNFESLNSIVPNANYIDIQEAINLQRMKKSVSELQLAQSAVDIIEQVLEAGIKKAKLGMTEVELIAELEFLMHKFGADGPSFSTLVLSGEKSALPHGSPGNRKFKDGDFLLIDMGVIKDGYCSDITRTFIFGEPTAKQKEIYETVLAANIAGIEAIQAGTEMKEFDLAARNVITKAGYGDFFKTRVGHGLGIEIHEAPSIHKENELIAEAGFLFTIEPGIYLTDFGGVRIEDDVYINESGKVEVLTSFNKQLIIL